MFLPHGIVNSQTHMTADMIKVNSVSDMKLLTLPCLPCAAWHGTAYASMFSGKIVSGINLVVRTDNQSVPKMNL